MRKTGTWLAGILIGLTLGLATSLLVNRPEVRADDKKPKWEYKVASFRGNNDDISTKQIQGLADDGWDYVGLVRTSAPNVPTLVAFKRPKK
jgi:hypothetical protein